MIDAEVASFISHYGVQGMKWGVRKGASRADKKWAKKAQGFRGAIDVHNAMADRMNNGVLDKLNNKPEYKNQTFDANFSGKVGQKYLKEYQDICVTEAKAAVAKVHGTSPSGQYRAVLAPDGNSIRVEEVSAQHAADVRVPTMTFKLIRDRGGKILSMKLEESMSQSMTIQDFLAHYGVQGMKWGVRRATNKSSVAALRGKGLSKRSAKATVRYQNKVDMQKMAAKGNKDKKVSTYKQLQNRSQSNMMLSPRTILRHPISTQKAATLQLKKNTETQAKILKGEKRVQAALIKLGGVSMKDVNYKL